MSRKTDDKFLAELRSRFELEKTRLSDANKAAVASDNELQEANAEYKCLKICIAAEERKRSTDRE